MALEAVEYCPQKPMHFSQRRKAVEGAKKKHGSLPCVPLRLCAFA
jgi:hypothetical protein